MLYFVIHPGANSVTSSKIAAESKYVVYFFLLEQWTTPLATGLHACHPQSRQLLIAILISLVKSYHPSMPPFLTPSSSSIYNHLYRKATKSHPPVPGSPDFSKLDAVTLSYGSMCLILRMILTPPSDQARLIWHRSAASLTLGDYTLYSSYLNIYWMLSSQLSDAEAANMTPLCSPAQVDNNKHRSVLFTSFLVMTTAQKMSQQETLWESCLHGNETRWCIVWLCGGDSKAKEDTKVITFWGNIGIGSHWLLTGRPKGKQRW